MDDDEPRHKFPVEQLNVGIVKYLEKKRGICKVVLEDQKPADRHTVLTWEQRNTSMLPEDLKSFYLTSNGFDLTWSVKMENGTIPVGKMHINPILQLTRLAGAEEKTSYTHPSLADLDPESEDEDSSGVDKPSLTESCRIYELDPCNGYGKVCLVYRAPRKGFTEPGVEIWFLDRALRWHFLTHSFLAYYRLMIMHLGLPFWQYSFTDIGLSPQSKQWFNMFAPVRLDVDKEIFCDSPHSLLTASLVTSSPLDVSKVFRGRSDRKKNVQTQGQAQNIKKKLPATSARSQSSLSSKPSSSHSSVKNFK
ncbi:tubulin polyglutamylase complex subunit 2-like [Gigantopelta aegis]|uniref:tubulin polyglutamylase complex subunit 2-like n=1 Tax=Gigantopelta aegis TaxID=1735272 RepID=UPI001B887F94|nr:tubulin polyglutamylase complex subunit 2-like [Gigantopelta aegis]